MVTLLIVTLAGVVSFYGLQVDAFLVSRVLAIAPFPVPQEVLAMPDHSSSQPPHPFSPSSDYRTMQYRTMIETARKAWIDCDAHAFVQLFSPSGQMRVPGQCWIGREAIYAAMQAYCETSSVIGIDIKHMIVEGDRASVEWSWHDVERTTGHHHQADDAIIVVFQDGLIASWREYIDTETPQRSLE